MLIWHTGAAIFPFLFDKGSTENGQSTTHGWRSSRFLLGTVLWMQT